MGGVYQGMKLPTPTTEVYHKLWVVYQEDVREEKQRGFFLHSDGGYMMHTYGHTGV